MTSQEIKEGNENKISYLFNDSLFKCKQFEKKKKIIESPFPQTRSLLESGVNFGFVQKQNLNKMDFGSEQKTKFVGGKFC